MKVLLTGGAGYIASHTAIELIAAGHDVIIADNFCNSKKEVLERIKKITGVTIPLYEIDVSNYNDVDNIFAENHIDAVIHFAGLKAVGESVSIPLKYYRNNIDTTLTLLEVMQKHNVNNFVFSSSATVYGVPEKLPLVEGMPTSCTNPYGWTKLMNEQILLDVANANKELSIVILRYFNPIGAHESGLIGEDPNGVPNNLMPYISQVAIGRRERLSVYGNDYDTKDGTGVRDYIHVVDLAKGHVAAIEYTQTNKGTEIFNLGTGNGYSVLEMVNTFSEINHVNVPYEVVDRRPGDISICYANADKAYEKMHWKAEKTLEEMCKDTWNWQTKNPSGY